MPDETALPTTPPPAPEPRGPIQSVGGLIEAAGKLRDGLLVLASAVYLLGYLSWTFYAVTYRIGLIPALDAQYFTAGIVPAVVFISFYAAVRLLVFLSRWSGRPRTRRQVRLGRVLAGLANVALLLGMIRITRARQLEWLEPLGFAVIVIVYVSTRFFIESRKGALLQFLAVFPLWGFAILGSLWLKQAYFVRWFPTLPHELGGPSPRCVQLDVVMDQVSPITLGMLSPGGARPMTADVVRTQEVYLLFDGSEFVLIKKGPEAVYFNDPVYRIRKSAVEGMFPCE